MVQIRHGYEKKVNHYVIMHLINKLEFFISLTMGWSRGGWSRGNKMYGMTRF